MLFLEEMKLLTRLKYAIQCSVPKGMTSAVSMMSISEQPDQPLAALLQDTIILYEDYERKSGLLSFTFTTSPSLEHVDFYLA